MMSFLRSIVLNDARDAASLIEAAVSDYIESPDKKLVSVDILRGLVDGKHYTTLIGCLAKHLGPRWNDTSAWCREEDCIILLQRLSSIPLIEAIANHQDMMQLLDYHLRACLLTTRSSSKQMRVARSIQQFLDEATGRYDQIEAIRPLKELQSKYQTAWADNMHCARERIARYRDFQEAESTSRPVIQVFNDEQSRKQSHAS
jgi:hypothetical protein